MNGTKNGLGLVPKKQKAAKIEILAAFLNMVVAPLALDISERPLRMAEVPFLHGAKNGLGHCPKKEKG